MQNTPWYLEHTSRKYRLTAIGLALFLPAYHLIISQLEGLGSLLASIAILFAFRLALDLFVREFRFEGITLLATVTFDSSPKDDSSQK